MDTDGCRLSWEDMDYDVLISAYPSIKRHNSERNQKTIDSFFGFTSDEVKEMLDYYGMSEKESELKDWYDGYLFGSEEKYCCSSCLGDAYGISKI